MMIESAIDQLHLAETAPTAAAVASSSTTSSVTDVGRSAAASVTAAVRRGRGVGHCRGETTHWHIGTLL
jgi:hypothetical protein